MASGDTNDFSRTSSCFLFEKNTGRPRQKTKCEVGNMEDIYVTKAFLPPMEEYIDRIRSIWESHRLTNMGSLHQEFERKLTQYLRVPYCLAFANGHLSLETALQAYGLTGEVITTPFTFASTTHAIVRNQLAPVFCDICKENYTIDVDKIEELVTEKTSAILPVHVYGQVCSVKKIQEIADRHHLKVIYDAAHAFGVTVKGQGIGNFGDASIFSFHATKPFHSIEGGAITFRSFEDGVKMYQIKNFGFMGEDMVCAVGGNAKMSEFHAAMGLCNMEYLDEILTGRKRVVERYRERLKNRDGIVLLPSQEGVQENYAYFPILIKEDIFGENRDSVYERLAKNGIHARRYFYPLTKDFPCYKHLFQEVRTPVAEYVAERVLTLPLYDGLSEDEVDRISDILLQ